MAEHKVRSHHWNNGILSVREQIFESLEEAIQYIANLECHSAKVYDSDSRLINTISGNFPTYA